MEVAHAVEKVVTRTLPHDLATHTAQQLAQGRPVVWAWSGSRATGTVHGALHLLGPGAGVVGARCWQRSFGPEHRMVWSPPGNAGPFIILEEHKPRTRRIHQCTEPGCGAEWEWAEPPTGHWCEWCGATTESAERTG